MYYSINHNTCMFKYMYIIFIASYEVQIDGITIYSKLKSKRFPDETAVSRAKCFSRRDTARPMHVTRFSIGSLAFHSPTCKLIIVDTELLALKYPNLKLSIDYSREESCAMIVQITSIFGSKQYATRQVTHFALFVKGKTCKSC